MAQPYRRQARSAENSAAMARASLGLPEESALSDGMVEVMQRSQLHYLEGSNLIKIGDSEKAPNLIGSEPSR